MLERSPRVKAIDFHSTNSWVVFGLYSGTLALHDYQNNVLLYTHSDLHPHPRSFDLPSTYSQVPMR